MVNYARFTCTERAFRTLMKITLAPAKSSKKSLRLESRRKVDFLVYRKRKIIHRTNAELEWPRLIRKERTDFRVRIRTLTFIKKKKKKHVRLTPPRQRKISGKTSGKLRCLFMVDKINRYLRMWETRLLVFYALLFDFFLFHSTIIFTFLSHLFLELLIEI